MANRETRRLAMAQVNGPIPFTATWDNELKTYDPRTEGHFAVANTSGREIDLGTSKQGYKQTLSLSYGMVGTPQPTLERAVAELAITIALWPEAQAQLSIVKLPCVFSTRDGWVDVDYTIPVDLLNEAVAAADRDRRYGDRSERFWSTAFERKHGLRF
jgi:hypothetical protein